MNTQPLKSFLTLRKKSWSGWQLCAGLGLTLAAALPGPLWAADSTTAANAPATSAKSMSDQVREAVERGVKPNKRITLIINGHEKQFNTPPEKVTARAEIPAEATAKPIPVAINPKTSRQYIRAKAAALAGHETAQKPLADDKGASQSDGEVYWGYEGKTGPQFWGQLNPEFNLCATGKRQSPINIDESTTLQGPAELLQFNYQPSGASVVNNGHTIQVDLFGENSVTVRGSSFKLLQFHFHSPSEEQVNDRHFAMVAHLVHQNAEGQLAVVAVLLEPGVVNPVINQVWTYMPLDIGDRVRIPAGLINMNELLPKDQRYYQFMGSLTMPPCTEGVLWMVLKQPTAMSHEQIKLFTQLFPHNARPVQPVNGRAVRDAQ